MERFIAALAEVGLSPAGRGSDEAILTAIGASPEVVAELKNVRYWAAYQMDRHTFILSLASSLAERLDDAIS